MCNCRRNRPRPIPRPHTAPNPDRSVPRPLSETIPIPRPSAQEGLHEFLPLIPHSYCRCHSLSRHQKDSPIRCSTVTLLLSARNQQSWSSDLPVPVRPGTMQADMRLLSSYVFFLLCVSLLISRSVLSYLRYHSLFFFYFPLKLHFNIFIEFYQYFCNFVLKIFLSPVLNVL